MQLIILILDLKNLLLFYLQHAVGRALLVAVNVTRDCKAMYVRPVGDGIRIVMITPLSILLRFLRNFESCPPFPGNGAWRKNLGCKKKTGK